MTARASEGGAGVESRSYSDEEKSFFEGLGEEPYLLVDKTKLTLSFISETGSIVRIYDIACAENLGNKTRKGDRKTPEGQFRINQILDSHYLSHDFQDGNGPIYGAYGPWFLRLDVPGFIDIGIHGTHLPESIGSRATEGCIRLRNEDIIELKERVTLGMPVVILPDRDPSFVEPADTLAVIDCPPDSVSVNAASQDTAEAENKRTVSWILTVLVLGGLAAAVCLVLKKIRKSSI